MSFASTTRSRRGWWRALAASWTLALLALCTAACGDDAHAVAACESTCTKLQIQCRGFLDSQPDCSAQCANERATYEQMGCVDELDDMNVCLDSEEQVCQLAAENECTDEIEEKRSCVCDYCTLHEPACRSDARLIFNCLGL